MVRVTAAGFTPFEQTNVSVTVGSAANVIAQLKVGQVSDSVTVSDSALLLDTTKTSEVDLVDRKQIQDLPINGRRVDQFALLSPGVTRDGRFGLLSFRGTSGNFNNYLIEGNDDNQAYFSEPRGRTRIASSVSANAVQEFQVGKGAYLAELGRSSGGAINTVIRSGGNQTHGDAFWYYRDQNFQARDPLASLRPDERRQQFGGSFSGAILKDKLFYFANYDQQLRDFPLLIEDLNGVLGSGRPVLPANPTAAQQTQYNTDLVAFNAGSAFLKSKFPNGAPGNTQSRNLNQYLGLAKIDYLINQSNTLSVFYNQLWSSGERAIQSPIVLPNVGRNGSDDVRVNSFNARLTSTFGPSHINEFRFQFGRDFEFQFSDQPPPQTTIAFGGNPFSFGRATFLERPALPNEYRYQFIDNFSIITGNHNFKFGGEVNRVYDGINNPANFGGQYTYPTALAIGRDIVSNFTTRNYTTYTQSFGSAGASFSTIEYAVFAQDQWRINKNVTLTYGLRYDYQQLPDAIAPNPAEPATRNLHSNPTQFGPRGGVAWNIFGNGKTILRGGYALYYARIPNGLIQNALSQTGLLDNPNTTQSLSLQPTDPGAPLYPTILSSIPATARLSTSITRLATDYAAARIQDISVGFEQQIGANWAFSGSYIYTYGDKIGLSFDTNLPTPTFSRSYQLPDGTTFTLPYAAGITRTAAGATVSNNLARPNPAFGSINVTRPLGKSWYNGMFLELKRKYANGLQASAAYTLAKAENLAGNNDGGGTSAEGAFGGGVLADQFNIDANRGTAATDQRHKLTFTGIWEPRIRGDAPVRKIVNGFRLSGIYVAESGRPVSQQISTPSLPFLGDDGNTYNGFGGIRGQGTGGDRNIVPFVTRNTLYGEWNYRFDLRIARDIPITERARFEVIGEAFNIFNTSNFNGYLNTQYTATATANTTPLKTPVQLVRTSNFYTANNDGSQPDGTNARRLQISLRFRF